MGASILYFLPNLISIVIGAISAILPNYIFKVILLSNSSLIPEVFIKRLYYAQVLKILMIIGLLGLSYLLLDISAAWLTISFVVMYVTSALVAFFRYGYK